MSHEIKNTDQEEILDALGKLPQHDVDSWRKERIRILALAELEKATTSSSSIWQRKLYRAYYFVLEPAFLVGASGLYLFWAVRTVQQILSG